MLLKSLLMAKKSNHIDTESVLLFICFFAYPNIRIIHDQNIIKNQKGNLNCKEGYLFKWRKDSS